MGNYYAGMINNTGGYGELRHHGILGQKWGVRRFQNADGSLTAAGRERYYGKDGQKEIAKALKGNGTHYFNREQSDSKLKKLPQIQDAAKQLSEDAEKVDAAEKVLQASFDKIYNKLQNSPELHEKWLNRAVDNFIENNHPKAPRKEVYGIFKYDFDDLDKDGVVETYMKESNDPDVRRHSKIYENYREVYKPFGEKINAFSKELYPDSIAKPLDRIRLNSLLYEEAKNYNQKHNPASNKEYAKQIEKDFDKYKKLQGTNSLVGGNHKNDESVKILREYHDELANKRSSIRRKVDFDARDEAGDRAKDKYHDIVGKIQEKYLDKYAKAVLKDMNYDVNDSTIAWLKKQYWFYMPGANAILL